MDELLSLPVLAEVIAYLTTPAPTWARRMGFVAEAVSIERRWRARGRRFEPHRRACQEAILDACEVLPAHGRVVVLGAGIVRDVPLDALARDFDEVVLVDCVFTRRTRRAARRHPNIVLCEHDLSGVCHALCGTRPGGPLPPVAAPLPPAAAGADLVVSLNVLSQLAIIPEAAARDLRCPGDISAWGETIEAAHVEALRALPVPVLLVSDYATVAGASSDPTLYVELSPPPRAWDWPLRTGATLKVGAWRMGAG